jgi:hypothetical protein
MFYKIYITICMKKIELVFKQPNQSYIIRDKKREKNELFFFLNLRLKIYF